MDIYTRASKTASQTRPNWNGVQMTRAILNTRILGVFVHVDETRGAWFSLGMHADIKHRSIDVHFIWWIITIGDPSKGRGVLVDGTWTFWDNDVDAIYDDL